MSAELGVGFALRTVNERIQQSVARRPRVRTGRRGLGQAEVGRHLRGAGCHGDAEGAPGGAGLQGLARFPQRSGLEARDFLEVGLVGEKVLT